VEQENLLQQTLRVIQSNGQTPAGVTSSGESSSGLQQRLDLLLTEREQLLRHSREDAEQIERLTSRVLSLILPSGNLTAASAAHDLRQSDLFRQIREEVVMRDRYAAWRQGRHPIVRDRPVTATRTIDEEAAEGVLAVRRMHMFRPPQGFRGTVRWVIEGVLLDPESERFLIEASRQRVAYREDMMARQTPDV